MERNIKIFLVSLTIISILIIASFGGNTDSPKQIVERKYGSNAIKEILLEKEIDDFPVFIYTNNDDELLVLIFEGLGINSHCEVPFFLNDYEGVPSYSWFQDNRNKHRIAWGLCEPQRAEIITVNGKHVQSEELRYTYNGKEQVVSFWYIVLEKDFDYKVRNTGDDYNLVNKCRVYLDENE